MNKKLKSLITFSLSLSILFSSNSYAEDSPKLFKLTSKDPVDRMMAVRYMAEKGDPRLVKTFCEMLLNDKSPEVRKTVAEKFGDNYYNNKEAENCLIESLKKEKNKKVIKNIVYALSKFEDKRAGRLLCNYLNSEDPDIRYYAVTGLMKFKGLCDAKLFNLLKKGIPLQEKILIAKTLGLHDYKPAQKYMEKLLNSKNRDDLTVALNYFRFHPSRKVSRRIEKILLNTKDEKLQELAFDTLVALNDPNTFKTLKLFLLKPEFQKRFAYRLPTFKRKVPNEVLKTLLESDSTVSKVAAITYIGEHKLKNFCNYLEKKAYSKNLDIQAAAIWALGKTNCDNSVRILYNIITSYNLNDDLRANAAKALSFLPKRTLNKNIKLLKDAYENEILDDIKEIILNAIKKGEEDGRL